MVSKKQTSSRPPRLYNVFTKYKKSEMCYIYPYRCLCPIVFHFQYSNFAIAITIQLIDHPPFTIYNVYLPGRPIHAANLLPGHIPKLPAILMGDLNAHHQWLYSSEATNTTQINVRMCFVVKNGDTQMMCSIWRCISPRQVYWGEVGLCKANVK
jgi:hypothetical protein